MDNDGDIAQPPVKKTSAHVKRKALTKPKDFKTAKGGCQPGAQNFGHEESLCLLKFVQNKLPIGGASWDSVTAAYNKWAVLHSYVECDRKSLKGKFDA
ncbi:hypothetical protein H0H87_004422, partial [Tephrocybe sp. NHM501043]